MLEIYFNNITVKILWRRTLIAFDWLLLHSVMRAAELKFVCKLEREWEGAGERERAQGRQVLPCIATDVVVA